MRLTWSAAAVVVFLALVAGAPMFAPPFWVTLGNYIGLYSIAALGLVLLTGVAGQTSFGQAAFVGLGAYASAWLTTSYGSSPWVALAAGLAFTALVALALGFITLRMRGHYLPLATIAWGISLYFLFGNLEFLGGHTGMTGIPAIAIGGLELKSERSIWYLIWGTTLASLWATNNLLDSRPGRAIRSLRGGYEMAEAFGVDGARLKIVVFIYAALLAAVSGWLYVHLQRFVNPTPFSIIAGIEYLFMAVVGGAGSVWGAVVGAALITVLKQVLQDVLPQLLGRTGNFEMVVFGVLLIVLLQRARDGVWPWIERLLPKAPPAPVRDAAPLAPRDRGAASGPLLEVNAARKTFGGLVAVNDLSFRIEAGEIVGLIGPNGAGKSTTFNLITGVLGLTKGDVRFRGQPVGGLSSRQIAQAGMSRTFQHVKMIPEMTVLENVALGGYLRSRSGTLQAMLRLDRAEERGLFAEAEAQLQRIGMAHQMHELAGNLALGPQRLMEIARALCTDPALLLLDEPAAGLRHQEKLALAGVLRQLKAEGLSILLVEHDMDFVMGLTDRIVVMEFGTRLIEGTPAEVQASPVVRAAYLGTEH